MAVDPIIVVEECVKRFTLKKPLPDGSRTLTAVDGISFDVAPGTCFGMLGPNGAGKTTTVKMLQGFWPLSSGRIAIDGVDVTTDPRTVKARCGVCPQDDNLDPDFTVERNLLVFARYFRIPKAIARQRTTDLLAFVQLSDKKDQIVQTLSGGMKRRLAIARALINEPRALILDEPTTGLDPQARHLIWEKVRDLKRQGVTIVLTTHYMDEAEQLCDELVVIDHGRIVTRGAPKNLIAEHVGATVIELHDVTESARAWLDASAVHHRVVADRAYLYVRPGDAPDLPDFLVELGVAEVVQRRASLEDVFLVLTGHALRD